MPKITTKETHRNVKFFQNRIDGFIKDIKKIEAKMSDVLKHEILDIATGVYDIIGEHPDDPDERKLQWESDNLQNVLVSVYDPLQKAKNDLAELLADSDVFLDQFKEVAKDLGLD